MTHQSEALVILNGEIPSRKLLDLLWQDATLTICADGAANALIDFKMAPDVIIGDFDSISKEYLDIFTDSVVIKIENQETTDGEKALSFCLDRGVTKVNMVGAFGKRLDHTLYNLELLKKFHDQGLKITCFTDKEKAFLIENSMLLTEESGTIVSIIPVFGTDPEVSLDGFQFNLKKKTLRFGKFSSISNSIQSPTAKIEITSGQALLIISHNLLHI